MTKELTPAQRLDLLEGENGLFETRVMQRITPPGFIFIPVSRFLILRAAPLYVASTGNQAESAKEVRADRIDSFGPQQPRLLGDLSPFIPRLAARLTTKRADWESNHEGTFPYAAMTPAAWTKLSPTDRQFFEELYQTIVSKAYTQEEQMALTQLNVQPTVYLFAVGSTSMKPDLTANLADPQVNELQDAGLGGLIRNCLPYIFSDNTVANLAKSQTAALGFRFLFPHNDKPWELTWKSNIFMDACVAQLGMGHMNQGVLASAYTDSNMPFVRKNAHQILNKLLGDNILSVPLADETLKVRQISFLRKFMDSLFSTAPDGLLSSQYISWRASDFALGRSAAYRLQTKRVLTERLVQYTGKQEGTWRHQGVVSLVRQMSEVLDTWATTYPEVKDNKDVVNTINDAKVALEKMLAYSRLRSFAVPLNLSPFMPDATLLSFPPAFADNPDTKRGLSAALRAYNSGWYELKNHTLQAIDNAAEQVQILRSIGKEEEVENKQAHTRSVQFDQDQLVKGEFLTIAITQDFDADTLAKMRQEAREKGRPEPTVKPTLASMPRIQTYAKARTWAEAYDNHRVLSAEYEDYGLNEDGFPLKTNSSFIPSLILTVAILEERKKKGSIPYGAGGQVDLRGGSRAFAYILRDIQAQIVPQPGDRAPVTQYMARPIAFSSAAAVNRFLTYFVGGFVQPNAYGFFEWQPAFKPALCDSEQFQANARAVGLFLWLQALAAKEAAKRAAETGEAEENPAVINLDEGIDPGESLPEVSGMGRAPGKTVKEAKTKKRKLRPVKEYTWEDAVVMYLSKTFEPPKQDQMAAAAKEATRQGATATGLGAQRPAGIVPQTGEGFTPPEFMRKGGKDPRLVLLPADPMRRTWWSLWMKIANDSNWSYGRPLEAPNTSNNTVLDHAYSTYFAGSALQTEKEKRIEQLVQLRNKLRDAQTITATDLAALQPAPYVQRPYTLEEEQDEALRQQWHAYMDSEDVFAKLNGRQLRTRGTRNARAPRRERAPRSSRYVLEED